MNDPASILGRPERLRLRVKEFELLESSGAFEAYGKAELIDGNIYVMNAQFARHGLAKVRLLVALANRLEAIDSNLDVFSEVSVRVAADSMPEPDIFLAHKQAYGPVPIGSVALVIEVSDTTLHTDLGRKADLYAAAGVPEYWVIDLHEERALLHGRPSASGYEERLAVPFGEPLCSSTIDRLVVGSGGLVA